MKLPNDKPREYPRGRWHHQEQVELVKTKDINTTEYYFLGLVDALCHWKRQGCWASDEYLANELGVSDRQVRNIITHLTNHTLNQKGRDARPGVRLLYLGRKVDGTRILVTKWFLAECDGELPGVSFEGLETNFQNPGNKFPNGAGNKFPQTGHKSKDGEIERKSEGVSGGKPAASPPPLRPHPKKGDGPSNHKGAPPFCYEWERELRRTLRSRQPTVGPISGSRDAGADALRRLWRQLGANDAARDRVGRAVAWLGEHINTPGVADKLPRMRKVAAFCDRLTDWIEGKMEWWAAQQARGEADELRKKSEAVEEESGFRVRGDRIERHVSGDKWKTIPRDEEEDYPIYIVTKEYAEYIRSRKQSR